NRSATPPCSDARRGIALDSNFFTASPSAPSKEREQFLMARPPLLRQGVEFLAHLAKCPNSRAEGEVRAAIISFWFSARSISDQAPGLSCRTAPLAADPPGLRRQHCRTSASRQLQTSCNSHI